MNAARTTANWMHKQPPLSPTRNPAEMQQRINTSGMDASDPHNLMGSQSSYSRQAKDMMGRPIQSPEAVKLTDSQSDFHPSLHHAQTALMRQKNAADHEMRAYKQYQQQRMPIQDNDEPQIPQFQVGSSRGVQHARTTNASYSGAGLKTRSPQLPNI